MKIKKTKLGDYERKVTFAVWCYYDVHVVFTDSIPLSRKARYGTAGLSDGAGALHTYAQGGHAHLFFKIGDCPTGVVAHECWHAIYALMNDWAGVKEMDNEAVAYHLGYLVQQVVNFRNDLIDAGVGVDMRPNANFGVKSRSRKKATNGNKNSQRELVDLHGVPTHSGGASTEAGEAGTPNIQTQADQSTERHSRPSRSTCGCV